MSKPKAEFIEPRAQSQRLQLERPVFDADAVLRADDTLKAMSGSFGEWLEADVAKLQAARMACENAAWNDASLSRLFAAAHDLKGMGATYGYPLTTQLAASLCRLIETDEGKAAARDMPQLARAHVDAVRAAVRDGVRSSGHPVGRTLLEALEMRVESLGVSPE